MGHRSDTIMHRRMSTRAAESRATSSFKKYRRSRSVVLRFGDKADPPFNVPFNVPTLARMDDAALSTLR